MRNSRGDVARRFFLGLLEGGSLSWWEVGLMFVDLETPLFLDILESSWRLRSMKKLNIQ